MDNKKLIIEELIVKNAKQLGLEIRKYVESQKIKFGRFKAKCPDFTLLVKYENGQIKFRNKSHTAWDGFENDKDWVKPKRFNIYNAEH